MRNSVVSGFAGLAMVVSMTPSAWAQDAFAACDCIAPQPDVGGSVATVVTADGGVVQVTGVGFQTLIAGENLGANSEVLTGPTGNAEIAVGSACIFRLQSNQRLLLSTPAGPEGNICASADNTANQQLADNQGTTGGADARTLGLALGGAAIVGGAILIIGDGDDPASP